jgi:DNA-binding PadR family transcriptional regulator|tara:strand:- start:128 stop:448 length:321 start_codon:yes stop_codon:yes gene_type:complete
MIKASDIDKLIHAPIRLSLMTTLCMVSNSDFTHLKRATSTSDGNLNIHLGKLEEANYVSVVKSQQGKRPRTTYAITPTGQSALTAYLKVLQGLTRSMGDLSNSDND